MSLAKVAQGTLFKVGDGASVEVFTTIPEVTKLTGPSMKFDLLDATSHDSAGFFREYVPGLADGDNVAAEINWRPANAVHKALRIDSYARTLRNIKLVFPDTTDNTATMASYIANISPSANIGELLKASLTNKVTGSITWS